MQSRVILFGVLVLAVSLTLGLLFFRHSPEGGRDPAQRTTPALPIGTTSAPNPDVTSTEKPAEADSTARSTAGHPSAEATRLGSEGTRLVLLTGRLVNGRGEVVAAARIFVARADRVQGVPLESMDPTRLARAQRMETSTDERGVFSLTEVPAVPLRLAVRSKGHAPHDALIALTDARHDLGDIVLADSVVLDGRVLDRARHPVSGATLRRLKIDASPAEILGESPDDIVATTDDGGVFHVDELASGPWVLLIKAAKHPDRIEKGETKSAGQVVSGLEFVLDDGAEIEGRVVNAPADLLENSWVTAVPADGGSEGRVGAGEHADEKRFLIVPRRARCAPDGSFTIGDLTAGIMYRVAARSGEPDPHGRIVTKWVEARAGERKIELVYQPETALVFQAVDAATSQPITEMEVRVGKAFKLMLSDDKGRPRRHFPEGRVRFEHLFQRPLEEDAVLVIEARGYAALRVGDLRPQPDSDLDLGVLRLDPVPMVLVKVVDAATHEPVAGARVALTRPADVEFERFRPSERSSLEVGLTDDEGGVRLNSLPGERAFLTATHAGHAPHRGEPFVLERGGDREETIALTRGGTVIVVVVDALGAAARGVKIEHRRLLSDDWASESQADLAAPTDAKGELRFEHLPAGRHRFAAVLGRAHTSSASASAEVTVAEGGEQTVTLHVAQRARVSGRVTESGAPLSGAALRFIPETAPSDDSLFARTNGNGDYTLNDVELGAYRVRIVHDARAMACEYAARIETATFRFDVDLPRATIEGTILDETGQPLAGALVRIEPALGTSDGVVNVESSMHSGADGKYVLRGLRPDTAVVVAAYGDGYQPARSAALKVAAGELMSGIDLRPALGAALEVVVMTSDVRPAANCFVRLVWAGNDAPPSYSSTLTTDAAGRARFRGLRPGSWTVYAETATGPAARASLVVVVETNKVNSVAVELR